MRLIGAVYLCSVLYDWEWWDQTRHAGFEQKEARSNPDDVWTRALVTAEVDGGLWHILLEVDEDI